ncbi:hypothetical protein [Vitiosangium sp. GDMCC 1.1324]|uniref:hypothetical protein n=1 Tax=Vitiosangium sp. (strain GDMCC 1.1324) TaxID=2138576 RepID=UPI000D3D25B6|nr:hypothetical protein [Vitiosangium sp. GDMCC 1.1324]PTL85304.1 hypothetical protein DAT35_00845 [Vitiosangium sp. GDMCC 1.1324]
MCSHPVSWLLLLVGLLAGGWPARAAGADAAPVSTGGGIRIRCIPEHVLLGSDREAEVRLELDSEATGVELLASRGEVGPLTRVAPGVFRATYVPPRQSLPLEVILVALARGPRGGFESWSVLPLWGQGQAEVRTLPGAPVTLQVGERTFGPVQADAAGLASIPVEVPPGLHEAFFGRKRIDLGVPPAPLLHAVVGRREVRADREETVDIRLYTLKPEGEPPRPDAFSFSVSRGTVSAPALLEKGVLLLRWTVPPGPVGRLELKGSVAGERRRSVGVRLEAVPGPAQRFEMRVDREALVASEEVRVAVKVAVRDALGNPAHAGLRLESDVTGAQMLTERKPGEYAGVLELSPRFGGRERLELRVLAEGVSAPVGSRTLVLHASEPARVRVEPLHGVFVADGQSEAAWRISVEDRFGNPVREPGPEATLAGGLSGTLLPKEPGQYELRYVPPEARVDHLSELEVRVGKVRGRGTLPLLHRRPVLLVSPRAGLVTNFARVLAPSVGLRLEVWPLRSLLALGLLLDTGYLRFSLTGGEAVPGFTGRNEMFETSVAVGLRTLREQGLQGWVGAGPSLARVRGRVPLGDGRVLEEGAWVLGAQAFLGVGLRLGPGQPFLETRFCWFDEPSLRVLRGVLRGGGLHLGYRLALF